MSQHEAFAGMLAVLDIPADEAARYSKEWAADGFVDYGVSLACRVMAPWVAPFEPMLWHQRWAMGKHRVSLDEAYREKAKLFLEFWPQVGFEVSPAFVQGYDQLTIGDAQRALVSTFQLRQQGYTQQEIIAVARHGALEQMVEMVQAGMPREYLSAALGDIVPTR